ncbi:uncharacterized protein OCT59_011539 [Rhizophagus irregularis]|uniref:uncharacterized protein n=1 Tax=Rhizophagus irregularis TaxID=588596 RepID=UPI00331F7251|nr:hypothetical protein OCT59_011539 [Rhizophagus irregularis]
MIKMEKSPDCNEPLIDIKFSRVRAYRRNQSTTFENINKGSEVEEVNPENININSDLHRELSNVKAHNLSLWSSNAMLHVLSTTELNDTTMDQAPHESPNAELNDTTMDQAPHESPNAELNVMTMIQKSTWCLCCNYNSCNCRPIIHSTFCFKCGNYKCKNNKYGYKRYGRHIYKDRKLADPKSEISHSDIKSSLEKFQNYNISRKVHCSSTEVMCLCNNYANERIFVYNNNIKGWNCKDCKFIIKDDCLPPKDLFKCWCNFFEQNDRVFDFDYQLREWICRDCRYNIKILHK